MDKLSGKVKAEFVVKYLWEPVDLPELCHSQANVGSIGLVLAAWILSCFQASLEDV